METFPAPLLEFDDSVNIYVVVGYVVFQYNIYEKLRINVDILKLLLIHAIFLLANLFSRQNCINESGTALHTATFGVNLVYTLHEIDSVLFSSFLFTLLLAFFFFVIFGHCFLSFIYLSHRLVK